MRLFDGFIDGFVKTEIVGGDDQTNDYILAAGSTDPSGATW
jgi:hypothetical protein